MAELLLGIDVGTSAVKVVTVDPVGAVRARATVAYPIDFPRPGWAEQDPAGWWRATQEAVRAVMAEAHAPIRAIGLSGQMHGLVALGADDRPLRPAILWNDQRNTAECAAVTEAAGGGEALIAATNNPMLVGYTGGKLVWLRGHEPEAFARMERFLNPKDFIRLELTGEHATEVSDASGTGLFDVAGRHWAWELIDRLGLDRKLFPRAAESHETTGTLRPAVADALGLPAGIPAVGGGGDAVIQTTGSGVVGPGSVQVTIGTAGIVAMALDHCAPNPGRAVQVFCNTMPERWHAMGVTMGGGGALRWLRDMAGGLAGAAVDYDRLTALAAQAPAGSDGLLFVPRLTGERCPYPEPDAKGAWIGLTTRHGAPALARSVLEGVVYCLEDVLEVLRPLGGAPDRIVASGGAVQSPFWRRILADALGAEVVTVAGAAEGGAYGAALVAGVGIGVWPDVATATRGLAVETIDTPDPADGARYARGYEVFKTLHAALGPANAALGRG